jgi:hypothetical protein
MVQLIASQSDKFQESICKICCNCCLLECCIYLSGQRSMAASNKWPTTGRLRRAQPLYNLLLPGPVCLSNGPMQMPQPFQALAPTQIPEDSIFVIQVSIWNPVCMPGERHNRPCYKHLKMLQIGSSVWVAAFLNLHCDNRSRKRAFHLGCNSSRLCTGNHSSTLCPSSLCKELTSNPQRKQECILTMKEF